MPDITIASRTIGPSHPTYFIADIAANHDGDLERAKNLIHQAAEAGADAAKFQHFTAPTIVSDAGFKALGSAQSHQASWRTSVFDVYAAASLDVGWTPILKETCDRAGITFFTSPYSFDLVDAVDPFVPAFKVGSGDITWPDIIEYMAQKGKPMLLACGAASMDDVRVAMDAVFKHTRDAVLMQCNTNYTASLENFRYINLNVLRTFAAAYPDVVLGLSDHTPGHATVLGAVALGARVVEKHFTDNTERTGPDHRFSMDPRTWREMVDRTRELELALGSTIKRVEDNERETVVLQRRAIRLKSDVAKDQVLTAAHLEVLRPCPTDALTPQQLPEVIGRRASGDLARGAHLRWQDLT